MFRNSSKISIHNHQILNPGSQICGSTQLLRSVRSVLELFEDPGPSIEKGATQMARNLTSPGIELGRALCWGRVSGAHFLYKDKAACRSFYVLFYPRTCVDRFSSQANKSTLIASAISPGNVAIAAIFAHTKEAIHTIASFKKKLLRLSDRCRLKSRVPGRVQCPDW